MLIPYQTTEGAGVVAILYSQVPASNLSREIWLHWLNFSWIFSWEFRHRAQLR